MRAMADVSVPREQGCCLLPRMRGDPVQGSRPSLCSLFTERCLYQRGKLWGNRVPRMLHHAPLDPHWA